MVIVLNPIDLTDIKRKVLLRVGWVGHDNEWAILCAMLMSEIKTTNSLVAVIIIDSKGLYRSWPHVGKPTRRRHVRKLTRRGPDCGREHYSPGGSLLILGGSLLILGGSLLGGIQQLA